MIEKGLEICLSRRNDRGGPGADKSANHLSSELSRQAHLRYLERDGVTKDGAKGQVYSAERDVEDGRAFLDRGRQDRHQFRFIVSSEDGVQL